MTDREMLLVAYGALKANKPDSEIVALLEEHLFEREVEGQTRPPKPEMRL